MTVLLRFVVLSVCFAGLLAQAGCTDNESNINAQGTLPPDAPKTSKDAMNIGQMRPQDKESPKYGVGKKSMAPPPPVAK